MAAADMPDMNNGSLDEGLVRRAAEALLKHAKASEGGRQKLVDDDEVILVQVSLHKIPDHIKAKPMSIAIPHTLRPRQDCDMCLFVKDNAKVWVKKMMAEEPVEGLTKVRQDNRAATASCPAASGHLPGAFCKAMFL